MTLNDVPTYIYIFKWNINYFLFISITPSPFDGVFKWHSCMCTCSVTQSCPILCNPMDCNPPGSSVHGIFQARTLEWVAISYSRGDSQLRGQTCVSCASYIDRQILYTLSHLGSTSNDICDTKAAKWTLSSHRYKIGNCLYTFILVYKKHMLAWFAAFRIVLYEWYLDKSPFSCIFFNY